MKKLIIGLPKGSLQEPTYSLFKKAGFNITGGSRSYFPSIDDESIECGGTQRYIYPIFFCSVLFYSI